uniref:Uncharacterized protein n=1 Tax=viral metagenome TaxID=1070528 RepID=A0A6C0EJT2_9ZZZZ
MNNYINNIILYFLVIIILHLLIKIYLLESITEEFIQPTQPTLNNYIDENSFINNYDNNAKNELLGYLDNDLTSNSLPIDNTNDPTNTFSIDNTKNELLGYLDNNDRGISMDKYTFDEVPTLSHNEIKRTKNKAFGGVPTLSDNKAFGGVPTLSDNKIKEFPTLSDNKINAFDGPGEIKAFDESNNMYYTFN